MRRHTPRFAGPPGSTFESFAVRNYRFYFAGQTISGAGTWMQNVAVGWLAITSFHSGTILGIVTAARYAPLVLFGLWGGLVVDRLDKRSLLLVTQSTTASLSVTLGLLALHGHGHVGLLVLLTLVCAIGVADVFDVPGRQSIISEIVDRERVGNAIGLTAIATNSARAVGPAVGGLLIAAFGVAPCFLVNAVSFAAFIGALVAMRPAEIVASRESRGGGQVRAGLRYAWRTPPVLAALVMVAITGTLTWEYPVSLPLMTSSTFHGNASAYGFAMALFGLGAVAGGFVAARRALVTVRSLAGFATAWGIVVLAAALAPSLALLYVLLFLVGIIGITFNSAARTLLQMESAPTMRGRVMSLWFMGWQGSTTVGAPIVGYIGHDFGARYALGVGGFAAVAVGLFYLRAAPASAPTELRLEAAADD